MAVVVVNNGFINALGKGPILTGELISGDISVGDVLIVNNDLEIPIVEVNIKIFSGKRSFDLTIPRSYDTEPKWYELYGSKFEIKNTAYNNAQPQS